jgi:hypothetical protein
MALTNKYQCHENYGRGVITYTKEIIRKQKKERKLCHNAARGMLAGLALPTAIATTGGIALWWKSLKRFRK